MSFKIKPVSHINESFKPLLSQYNKWIITWEFPWIIEAKLYLVMYQLIISSLCNAAFNPKFRFYQFS